MQVAQRNIRTPANENAIISAMECVAWRNSLYLPHHCSRSAHLFPHDRPYGCNSADGYDINTLRISSLYVKFCGQTKHFWNVRVCSTSTRVTSEDGRHNPNAIRERGYQVRFKVSVWSAIVRDIFVGPSLLPVRFTAQQCRGSWETVLSGLPENVPLASGQRLWFLHDRF
jgi:hypothetical protein